MVYELSWGSVSDRRPFNDRIYTKLLTVRSEKRKITDRNTSESFLIFYVYLKNFLLFYILRWWVLSSDDIGKGLKLDGSRRDVYGKVVYKILFLSNMDEKTLDKNSKSYMIVVEGYTSCFEDRPKKTRI